MLNIEELPLNEVKYITREESVAIEINEFSSGTSAYDLMKQAGKAVADFVSNLSIDKSIIILCGGGNNGGDGIVAAKHLMSNFDVKLIFLKTPSTQEANKAYNDLDKDKLEIYNFKDEIDIDGIDSLLQNCSIIIDSIFGVGITSDIREPYPEVLELLSKYQDILHICSVDLPSGLDCNSGEWHGPEFLPKSVVTMQFSKKGLQFLPDTVEVKVADIGFSPSSYYIVGKGHLLQFWEDRKTDSHKGQNGRVMVIGGSDEFTGAPVLSGMAVLRSGVDTLRIAVPETIRNIVASYAEDFIVVKVRGDRHTSKGFKRFNDLTINRHDVVAIGMGLSNHPHSTKFARELFAEIKEHLKVVLDADAIRAFKDNLDDLKDSHAIITPHRAELRMMLNEQIPEKFPDLINFLQDKAKDLGIVILLKGKIDIITDGDRTLLNNTGHAGMTVGGTGDVLAGVVSAANCFVEDRFFATAIAAYIMGKSGELAAKKYGNSLLASDVIKEIPNVLIDI